MTADTATRSNAKGHALHIGVAETGKILALDGDHLEALRHYREALRLAHSAKAPEVFFRHYTQCVLESLEQTGSYAEVIDFCENAIRHFEALDAPLALHQRDHAAMLERYALNLLKAGRPDDARAPLEQATSLVDRKALPIADTVLDWLRRGMRAETRRIEELQKKYDYFSVRADRVEPARAIPLPDAPSGTGAPVL